MRFGSAYQCPKMWPNCTTNLAINYTHLNEPNFRWPQNRTPSQSSDQQIVIDSDRGERSPPELMASHSRAGSQLWFMGSQPKIDRLIVVKLIKYIFQVGRQLHGPRSSVKIASKLHLRRPFKFMAQKVRDTDRGERGAHTCRI